MDHLADLKPTNSAQCVIQRPYRPAIDMRDDIPTNNDFGDSPHDRKKPLLSPILSAAEPGSTVSIMNPSGALDGSVMINAAIKGVIICPYIPCQGRETRLGAGT